MHSKIEELYNLIDKAAEKALDGDEEALTALNTALDATQTYQVSNRMDAELADLILETLRAGQLAAPVGLFNEFLQGEWTTNPPTTVGIHLFKQEDQIGYAIIAKDEAVDELVVVIPNENNIILDEVENIASEWWSNPLPLYAKEEEDWEE